MPILDVFTGDPFSTVSMSAAITKLPFKPTRIGAMGLFTERSLTQPHLFVEEKDGALDILPTRERGGPPSLGGPEKRKVRSFRVLHIPHDDTILADDIQGVREFGTENQLQAISKVVNDRLAIMRRKHEVTREHLYIGAVKGQILENDGSTVLVNLFDEFDVTEQTVDFDFGTATTKIRTVLMDIVRKIEEELGAAMYDHIHGFAGKNWFDAYIDHDDVRAAFERWRAGEFLRTDVRRGFDFGGVVIEEYRGKVSGIDFVDPDQCRFFPVGVPDLFVVNYAPADFVETANTPGMFLYAKQKRLDFDRGIHLHSQSNLLPICTRPKVLIKGTKS